MILIIGGAGYIGSHCALELLEQGKNVAIFDNLSTGHQETIDKLKNYGDFLFIKGDLLNKKDLDVVFNNYKIDSVIHFAALSQVSQSMQNPELYYKNNVLGTINLLNKMRN